MWKRYVKDPTVSLYELTQPQAAEMIQEFVDGTEIKFEDCALYEFMSGIHSKEQWVFDLVSTLEEIDNQYRTITEPDGLLAAKARSRILSLVSELRANRFRL